MAQAFEPMRLIPRAREVVWGGRWLAEELDRESRPDAPLGESWEACSGSIVQDGPFAGRALGDLFIEQGAAMFGQKSAQYPQFPLLVKFIEAKQNLSVQVHPDDALAQKLENYPYGKTEFWYVLEAEPGAEIVYGLQDDVTSLEQVREAMEANDLLRVCRRVPVKPGDVVFILAGTVHALTAGLVVYELQQDCDITYRLYDWGRTDREMHFEKGLQAVKFDESERQPRPVTLSPEGDASAPLAESAYFRSEIHRIGMEKSFPANPDSFTLLTVTEGTGLLRTNGPAAAAWEIRRGDTLLIPAERSFTLGNAGGDAPFVSILSTL